ncbi:unnamed protein product [Adineta ricciae]|uniref:Uncharacterized protein n=1 Tax=Adineta ricciae TaxID=249248 RepID=A0A815B4J0_ADIRI|nr:unnamed protein product [Adineta ricciae]CAF1442450.1 unnamed protein product [Adineta ricciae]
MEQRKDEVPLETSLFRAIQKNKVLQSQSIRQQHDEEFQLTKYLKDHHTEEKFQRELLYSWKNETYLRDLKKKLRVNPTKNDAAYEYQLKTLNHLISGRPGLIIPPSEEQRRLQIRKKYEEFLRQNPLSTLIPKPAESISIDQSTQELARSIEETWKNIHMQSAIWSKQKQSSGLTTLRRSLTLSDIRRKSTRPFDQRKSSLSENIRFRTNHFELCESIEPPPVPLELVDRATQCDLFTMRSIRRPRQSSAELNSLYEARKHIYQMNRRVFNHQNYQKASLDHSKNATVK